MKNAEEVNVSLISFTGKKRFTLNWLHGPKVLKKLNVMLVLKEVYDFIDEVRKEMLVQKVTQSGSKIDIHMKDETTASVRLVARLCLQIQAIASHVPA